MLIIRNKRFAEKDTGSKGAKIGAGIGMLGGLPGVAAGAAGGAFLGYSKDALTGQMGDDSGLD